LSLRTGVVCCSGRKTAFQAAFEVMPRLTAESQVWKIN
jgi:molybdopterin synthase catalytic subunit